jgi:murein DD-endopeptidase MepM/ murein hydrolase activator NlpD
VTNRLPFITLLFAMLAGVGALAIVTQSGSAASLPEVEQRARDARAREQVLTSDVTAYNARIRKVEARLAPVQARWTALNNELTALRVRRQELTTRLEIETKRLQRLLRVLAIQRKRLADRLSAAYRSGDPTVLEIILRSKSLSDAASVRQNLDRIAEQDRGLIVDTKDKSDESRRTRATITETRAAVWETEQEVAVREAEAAKALAVVTTERNRLVSALQARRALLASVRADRRELEAEARGLRARSARLATQITSASVNLPSTVAVSGSGQLAWPLSGPITSPFGPRWGRMHEGIDIGAPAGTPIAAAAAGTVIVAGWSGGYGNLVVVSHGSIATAYGHMSRIAVSNGQSVGRGTVLGAVGCTGHCFGDHLHFEVRVGGVPQNPVVYL